MAKIYKDFYTLAAGIAALIIILFSLNSPYLLSLVVFALIHSIAAMGLAPLSRSGENSFSQGALMGVGAYTTGMLMLHGWNFFLTLPVAIFAGAAVAWIISMITVRLEGYYLVLSTLVFNLLFMEIVLNIPALGGTSGLTGIPFVSIGSFVLASSTSFLILVSIILLVLAFLMTPLFSKNIAGLLLDSTDYSRILASSVGADPKSIKRLLFIVSGVLAAIAGSLFTGTLAFVSVEPFGILTSAQILLMTTVGGNKKMYGPVVGAIIMLILNEIAANLLVGLVGSASIGLVQFGLYGMLIIIVIKFLPNGLTGIDVSAPKWSKSYKKKLGQGGGAG